MWSAKTVTLSRDSGVVCPALNKHPLHCNSRDLPTATIGVKDCCTVNPIFKAVF